MRATQLVAPSDWYFAAHLPGDPCMPGFLMREGAAQALAFYLTALGVTLPRDGWRFEAPPERTVACRLRGQVAPQAATIVYEVFVESLSAGPVPAVVADVTCRLEGRIVFHGRRLSLRSSPIGPSSSSGRTLTPPPSVVAPGL
jgi:3-hydroxymyristoyl/3-hydroxydecanoyl-(acyl carrier protein) dehydratase